MPPPMPVPRAPRSRRLSITLAIATALAVAASPALGQDYRLLVTNDDGIDTTALEELVLELSALGDVIVAAPAEDRSYHGVGKTLPSGMLRLTEVRMKGAVAAFSVDGTPVDAVTWAILAHGQDLPFDAVVAGINRGTAMGDDAMSVGVVGAAVAATTYGLPAVAISQDRAANVYDVAAGVAAQLVTRLIEDGLDDGVALSVNVPASASTRPRGVVAAPLGAPEYDTLGVRKVDNDDPRELWRFQFKKNRRPERGSDLDWFQRGEITVTPIRVGSATTELLEVIDSWEIEALRDVDP